MSKVMSFCKICDIYQYCFFINICYNKIIINYKLQKEKIMKKFVIAIAALAVVILGFFAIESSYSKDKIEFVGEAKIIEYYSEKLYFYYSLQDEFDATANLLDLNTKVVALDENAKIQFKLPHKPIRVYELAANEKGIKIKANYNKESHLYTLSDLYSAEVCEYDVVVDYGLTKNIYCFQIYNKTYIEKNRAEKPSTEFVKSGYSLSAISDKIAVTSNSREYQEDTLTFAFSVGNAANSPIKCSLFKLEKKVGNAWYSVKENDVIYNAVVYEKFKRQAEATIETNESNTVKLPVTLGTLFDLKSLDGVSSGIYRIAVPFSCKGENGYSISNSFTVGYVC